MKERDNVRPITGYEIIDDPEYKKLSGRKAGFFAVFITGVVLGAIAGGLGVYYLSR